MIRAMKVAVVAIAALLFAAVAAGGTPSGRIVFSATDAPFNDDVMLVRADGTKLDLSKSPATDTMPVASPNGRLVAFYSTRSGYGAEWVVAIDGKNLRRVTPALPGPPSVAWATNGRDLAIGGERVYRASAAGGVWARIDRGDGAQQLVGWSHDGTRVAYVDGIENVRVVSRTGKALFAVNGETAAWSPTGRLVAQRNSLIWDVYSETGKHLAAIPAESVAWSADGRLASLTPGGVLQVRPGGTGAPTFSRRTSERGGEPVWAGKTHVLLDGLSYDLAHNAVFEAPAAYRIAPAVARDGTAFARAAGLTLVHSTLSGSTRTVAKVPYCQGHDSDPFSSLQALPDGSGAVFAGDCAAPHDLFSVAPDGSGLTRITLTTADEIDPAVSPDGTRLAFTRVDGGADCAGCDHVIWTARLDGSGAASILLPAPTGNPIRQDDHPGFSPDGTNVVFSRWISSVGEQAILYDAPSTGGPATSLNLVGGHPAWGPSAIAFAGSRGVETVSPGGTAAKIVPGAGKYSDFPAWSSDGRLAVLDVAAGGALSIVLPAAKEHIALPGLRLGVDGDGGLAWSPDGTRLAFTATDRQGGGDVWMVGVDGKGLTRVTHGLGAEGALAWR